MEATMIENVRTDRLRVEAMPLSWMCERKGDPTITGRRVWGASVGLRMWTIERVADQLCLIHAQDGHIAHALTADPRYDSVWHSENVDKLASIAQWHEAEAFNGVRRVMEASTSPKGKV